MAGKKATVTTKAYSKTVTTTRQHNLFHFYQKKIKDQDEDIAANSNVTEVVALDAQAGGTSKSRCSVLPQDIIYPEILNPELNHGKRLSLEVNCAPSTDDIQYVHTLGEDTHDRIPENMSGNFFLQPSQPGTATVVAEKSTSGIPEAKVSVFLSKSPQSPPLAVFQEPQYILNSSHTVDNDLLPAAQCGSPSNTLLRRRHLVMKKASDEVIFRDVVDLTQSPEMGYTAPLNPGTFAAVGQHPVIVVDDESLPLPFSSGKQNDPIYLSSPTPADSLSAKMLHPFFAQHARNRQRSQDPTFPQSNGSTSRRMEVPWPDAWNQHNKGPQSSFRATHLSPFDGCPGPSKSISFPASSNLRFLDTVASTQSMFSGLFTANDMESCSPTITEYEVMMLSLPDTHREHPGISRVLGVSPNFQDHRMMNNGEIWSQKWRPRRAAEVLGNEANALYLKAWLQALELRANDKSQIEVVGAKDKTDVRTDSQGKKRPTVVRAVTKARGRKRRRMDSEDGSTLREWIADGEDETVESEVDSDSESPLHWHSTHLEGPSYCSSSRYMRHSRVNKLRPSSTQSDNEGAPFSEFSTLTNTILLAGPSGSGKTSTIYACAEELGWEVFEVYPGIGRRSGGNISSLVGDVGKNHLVGRRRASDNCKKDSSDKPGFAYPTDEIAIHAEDGRRPIRQSIILLDEVDILFKEDANFWPSVINMIRSSHRPVFLTCNDVSLIPRDDLPLQTCLSFQSCPSPLAVSFLQCVCLAEGHLIPRSQLEAVYAKTYMPINCDEPDEPSVPYPSQPRPNSDLRHSLNNLQFWCARDLVAVQDGNGDTTKNNDFFNTVPEIIPAWTEILADWCRPPSIYCGSSPDALQEYDIHRIGKHMEIASYIDGHLERRSSDELEALAIDRYKPSGDDEIGYTLLDKPTRSGRSGGLAFYGRDTDIAREALTLSRHVLETSGAGPRARSGRERGTTPPFDFRSLMWARVANQTRVVSFLDDLISLPGPLLPRPAAVLEYTPYVRQMILTDDVLEAEAASTMEESRHGRGRRTRGRWQMEDYLRHLTLSGEGVEAARQTSLS